VSADSTYENPKLIYFSELMVLNEDPVIDKLPGIKNAVIAAGFSYHGFKFLPIIGSLVADFVLLDKRHEILARMGWHRSKEELSAHSEILPKG
jgi:glycine/D-amino acid oxidase-like deaminating enzyme